MAAYDAYDIARLPTISSAQCCDLKSEGRGLRFWLCRAEGGITIERIGADGKWRISSGGCCKKVAYDPPRHPPR